MFTLLQVPRESQKRLSLLMEGDCSLLKWASAAGHMNQPLAVPVVLSGTHGEREQLDQRETVSAAA